MDFYGLCKGEGIDFESNYQDMALLNNATSKSFKKIKGNNKIIIK